MISISTICNNAEREKIAEARKKKQVCDYACHNVQVKTERGCRKCSETISKTK